MCFIMDIKILLLKKTQDLVLPQKMGNLGSVKDMELIALTFLINIKVSVHSPQIRKKGPILFRLMSAIIA